MNNNRIMILIHLQKNIIMNCNHKIFHYSGEKESLIGLVKVSSGDFCTMLTLYYPMNKQEQLAQCLTEADIPIQFEEEFGLSISVTSNDTQIINKALERLVSRGFIDQEFSLKILSNFSNRPKNVLDLPPPDGELKQINKQLKNSREGFFYSKDQPEADLHSKPFESKNGYQPS